MNFLGKLIRFGIVGVLTAVLHYGVLYIGVELVNAHATLASSVGFVVAVIFNYFMHYNWTFGEPAPHGRTLGRYLVMISCGFLINGGLMYAGEQWCTAPARRWPWWQLCCGILCCPIPGYSGVDRYYLRKPL